MSLEMMPKGSLPQLPGGPNPDEPVPRTPVEGFDLAAFAALAARLADGAEPRARALASAGLDEMRWLKIETTWLLRVATALLQKDLSLSEEYDAAFDAGRVGAHPDRRG